MRRETKNASRIPIETAAAIARGMIEDLARRAQAATGVLLADPGVNQSFRLSVEG